MTAPLSLKEASARWRVSSEALKRAHREGRLRLIQFTGRKWLVPWSEVERVDDAGLYSAVAPARAGAMTPAWGTAVRAYAQAQIAAIRRRQRPEG